MIYQCFKNILLSCALAASVAFTVQGSDDPEREGGLTGTGIVGEITALGSIIVNGQRITFEPEMEVLNSLSQKRADALVPGEVVAVAVVPNGASWTAEAISQIYPLVGPVSESGGDEFTVLGVKVLWSGLRPANGDWVAVSGFWARDAVVASRVQPIEAQSTASIQGSYRLDSEGNTPMVGSLRLNIDRLRHAQEGDVIQVTGSLENGNLYVRDVHLGLFDKPVSLVLAEGYLSDVAPSGHYTVAGSGLSSYTDNLQSLMATERILVCGIDGQLQQPHDLPQEEVIQRLGCSAHAN